MATSAEKRALRQAMIEEVHLRNMIAKYRDINLAKRKVAAIPQVGIFWYDMATNKVYSAASTIRDAEGYGNILIYDGTHYENWNWIRMQNPKWKKVRDYEDIPRGRVVYEKDPKKPVFIVYAPRELNNSKAKRAIRSEFGLPSGHVKFDFTDEHYSLAASEIEASLTENWKFRE